MRLGVVLLVALPRSAFSQGVPDAGSLLRDIERQQKNLPLQTAPHALPAVPEKKAPDDLRFIVHAFHLTGVTLVSEGEIQDALLPWVGREIGFSDLQAALDAVTQVYQRRGWFARPQLPVQDIGDEGIVLINVIEGHLGAIRLEEDSAPNLALDRVIGTMTARQQVGDPLNLVAMDRSINILNDIPGVLATATLAPGGENGSSDILIKISEKGFVGGTLSFDNTGARSTGAERLSANVTLDNPGRYGDQLGANIAATEGSLYGRLSYTFPVGYDGLRLGLNASRLEYRLIGDFASLRSSGVAETQGINAVYPLFRGSTASVNLSLTLDNKRYVNEANSLVTSLKRVQVTSLSIGGDFQDGWGQGGMTLWNLSLADGHLDLSGNVDNQASDRIGPRTEGSYTKLSGTLSRLQRVSDASALWFSVTGQHAYKNLDSSEQLTLGGTQGVRAYPTSEGAGDSGWIGTLEARHSLNANWQFVGFYDHGQVVARYDDKYITKPNHPNRYELKGYGASISYSLPSKYSLRMTVAQRLGNNPAANAATGADTDGSHKIDRVWFSAITYF